MSNLEENLSWQTIALESALGDVADALATNKGMHCLIRRRVDLEAAMTKYEEVFICHQQAADANACAAAEKVRRILKDSSDEALDLLVTLIEAKVEENASIVEVEDEICAAEAEVVVEMLAKELVDDSCAKFVVKRIALLRLRLGSAMLRLRQSGSPSILLLIQANKLSRLWWSAPTRTRCC